MRVTNSLSVVYGDRCQALKNISVAVKHLCSAESHTRGKEKAISQVHSAMILQLSYKFVEAVFVDAEGVAAADTCREMSSKQFVSTEYTQRNSCSVA